MKHPLYELQSRANQLESEIIACDPGNTEELIKKVLRLTALVRGLIAVGLAEVEDR